MSVFEFGERGTKILEVSFFEKEYRRELMEANRNKTPGSDSLTFKFSQLFWSELKGDML